MLNSSYSADKSIKSPCTPTRTLWTRIPIIPTRTSSDFVDSTTSVNLCCNMFAGIFSRSFLVAVRDRGDRVCFLLRSYISHRQTSEQGCHRSRRSWSDHCNGDHTTWSERRGSAAGDWSYNRQQIVSHRDEHSENNDHRGRLFHVMLDCACYYQLSATSWGRYTHINGK